MSGEDDEGTPRSSKAPLKALALVALLTDMLWKAYACCAAEDFKDHAVEQIAQWLSLSAVGRQNWMDAHAEWFSLEDLAHPAFARFKAVFEELDIRKAERGMRFVEVLCA